jgi:hypothetical protein
LGVEDVGGDCPVATAAIWSGEGAFHREAVQLSWTLDGEALGEGWNVPVCQEGLLQLKAIHPEGLEREAQVDVRLRATPLGIRREAVVLPDLEIEARRAVQGSEVSTRVPSGSALRVHLEGLSEDDGVSWMSPAGQAHLLGLDVGAADLLLETWEMDTDGAIVERNPMDGFSSHLVLVFDGLGGNSFMWVDGVFGPSDGEYLRHEGRLIESAGLEGEQVLSALIVVDDDGWQLRDLAPVDESSEMTADCAQGRELFSLDWIANGRCPLDILDGSQVLLEVW